MDEVRVGVMLMEIGEADDVLLGVGGITRGVKGGLGNFCMLDVLVGLTMACFIDAFL
jgi:hypothetical protein